MSDKLELIVAKHYGNTIEEITRLSIRYSLCNCEVERNVIQKILDNLRELNAYRLLFLTSAIQASEYSVVKKNLSANIQELMPLLDTNKKS